MTPTQREITQAARRLKDAVNDLPHPLTHMQARAALARTLNFESNHAMSRALTRNPSPRQRRGLSALLDRPRTLTGPDLPTGLLEPLQLSLPTPKGGGFLVH